MAKLPEILRRNRESMRGLLASFVIPPWEAEPMLVEILNSLPRQVWEGLSTPDEVLLTLLREACREFDLKRRTVGRSPSLLIEWETPNGRELALI